MTPHDTLYLVKAKYVLARHPQQRGNPATNAGAPLLFSPFSRVVSPGLDFNCDDEKDYAGLNAGASSSDFARRYHQHTSLPCGRTTQHTTGAMKDCSR